jgi:hypothetical protein
MIEIYTNFIGSKPIKKGNTTQIGSESKTVPVIKIKCSNPWLSNPQYYALIYKPEINAPYHHQWPEGEAWVFFHKNRNKQHKIPVMKDKEVIDV